jgi:hypothetical protein
MNALSRMPHGMSPGQRASRRLSRLVRPRRSALRQLQDPARRLGQAAPAVGGGFALAYFFDRSQGRRRRKIALQRSGAIGRRLARRAGRASRHVASLLAGTFQRLVHRRSTQAPPADDVTLARKVETEIFRPVDAPKATVNVDAVDGVVTLRGVVQTIEEIEQLERDVRAIPGVRDVHNLLHPPRTPAPTVSGSARR